MEKPKVWKFETDYDAKRNRAVVTLFRDGVPMGLRSWKANLNEGAYIVEARTARHWLIEVCGAPEGLGGEADYGASVEIQARER